MNRSETIVGAVIGIGAVWWIYSHGTNAPDGGTSNDTPEQMETSNAGWSQYVYQNSIGMGYHPEHVSRSLRKFNNGDYLDGEEYSFMKSALAHNGDPTVMPPMPNNSPVKGIQTSTGPQPVNSFSAEEEYTG